MTTWDGDGVDPWLPDRLAAEARIVAAERKLYDAWFASMSRWLVKARRGVFANGPRPDAAAVFSVAPDWSREMTRFVQGPVRAAVGLAYGELFGPGFRFDSRPAVVAHLAEVHNRMVRTTDDVYGLIAGEIAHGAAGGASIPEIAERVDELLSATGTERWSNRAVTVARTETVGSLNAGRYDAFAAVADTLGRPLDLMWLATVDTRTRESHVEADGQQVPQGQPFTVGGTELRFPGDPFGPAEETVNCRCTTLLVDPDETVDLTGRGFSDADAWWAQQIEDAQ